MIPMMNNGIAHTILEQLGGGRFLVTTGAKDLVAHERALSFRMPRGTADKSTHVKITLTGMDDYTLETFAIRGANVTPKSYRDGIYNEALRRVFTAVTGFETSLGTMGRER